MSDGIVIPGAQLPMNFSGRTYEPERDQVRLSGQALRVFELMKDGRWRTLGQIWNGIRGHSSIPGISARLRDFRKPEFGAHTVEREYRGNGQWAYRLIVRQK